MSGALARTKREENLEAPDSTAGKLSLPSRAHANGLPPCNPSLPLPPRSIERGVGRRRGRLSGPAYLAEARSCGQVLQENRKENHGNGWVRGRLRGRAAKSLLGRIAGQHLSLSLVSLSLFPSPRLAGCVLRVGFWPASAAGDIKKKKLKKNLFAKGAQRKKKTDIRHRRTPADARLPGRPSSGLARIGGLVSSPLGSPPRGTQVNRWQVCTE